MYSNIHCSIFPLCDAEIFKGYCDPKSHRNIKLGVHCGNLICLSAVENEVCLGNGNIPIASDASISLW